MKKVLYIDLDNTLVDFMSGVNAQDERVVEEYRGRLDEIPGVFGAMLPMKDAVDSFNELCAIPELDVYILSTAPWENPSAWSDKLIWVKKYLGANAYKRLILTHHKELNDGWMLIDDRPNNGADRFAGYWIEFGTDRDWKETVQTVRDMLAMENNNV